MKQTSPIRILVLLTLDSSECRDVWQGIEACRRRHDGLEIRVAHRIEAGFALGDTVSAALFVCPTLSLSTVAGLRNMGFRGPVGSVSFWEDATEAVDVGIALDDRAIAETAVEHFRDYGYQHLAFLGMWKTQRNAITRDVAMAACAGKFGMGYRRYLTGPGRTTDFQEVVEWLRDLPRNCGLLLGEDCHGPWMFDLLRRADRHAPGDLALLGVGNDPVLCSGSQPPLSSIVLPSVAMGEDAVESLFRMVATGDLEPVRKQYTPIGVEPRVSSDEVAVEDPRLRELLRYIRANVATPLSIDALAARVGWSRRTLELAFKSRLNRTPLQHLHRARIERAMQLMARGKSLVQVAEATGFKTFPHFARVFKGVAGMPPGAYAKQARQGGTETDSFSDRMLQP